MADDLTEIWHHFDVLKGLGAAPITAAGERLQNEISSEKYRGSIEAKPIYIEETGEFHICSNKCPFLIFGDCGDFVCTKTGLSFGCQISNGSFDEKHFRDDIISPPTSNGTRKRRAVFVSSNEEVFSAASQAIGKLMENRQRDEVDAARKEKTIKAGLRMAALQKEQPGVVNGMHLLFSLLAEMERAGVSTLERKIDRYELDHLAGLLAALYAKVIASYSVETHEKRPTNNYYSFGMLYLLANPNIGTKLHVPMLLKFLPEEKSLKNLGINVSRVTLAKRYCLDAIRHLMNKRKKETV